jgi:hypothetical protein
MKRYVVGLVCLVVGCAAGSTLPTLAAHSFGPNLNAPRWEQFCDQGFTNQGIGYRTKLRDSLERHGQEGWEFVTFTSGGSPCFKRPAPR